ncbi:SDR family oxidoreductase [Burkholderia cepacia]|uniref:SDR family oxidoreductase n=1 Tax=Burkholderia cepacia TaxID=292 RepID=UPI001C936227|nr:SDR family oxidoreductase [Burkholderia cepacia]MBY4712947.1 SDR family oxidoreductase [Burkholderia cepacia]MBY4736111.1 SDR family oxidoreductase [Burkholderia cepacia]MBY4746588.1 SDR family oxidoreductase [Burkholderia cepacia]MBY4758770.1 SDR family oxidoreductase [Burkholderia cepacia]MBY4776816.1 SDR family oxidoreductase [Burkholderia cepacia]
MKLNDQRVLVVGGSSGIGEATARAFAEAGATVTIASRDAAKLAASKDRVGYDMSTGVMDITDDASVRAFLDSAGEFDHVVVSAAQTATGPVRGLALDDAYAAMDSKFWGAYRIARAVRIRQGGSLTFVSGFLSVRPSKNSVLQGAINAALESLARGLALELAPVRVNTVSPGLIATPLWSKIDAEARDRMYEGAAARLPAGRVGQPEDVANAVLYLASTPYATGSTVLVDGGGAIA